MNKKIDAVKMKHDLQKKAEKRLAMHTVQEQLDILKKHSFLKKPRTAA